MDGLAKTLVATLRAGEWWEHKLAPMLGTGYMTAYLLGASILDLWPAFAATLAALAAAAAYTSIVNDLTDIDADRLAGKANRLAQRSRRFAAAALATTIAIGVGVAIVAWPGDPAALSLYAGSWIAFSLYSIPPARLKARGAPGILADAAGAHLFPQLLIAVAVFGRRGTPLDTAWIATIAVWALAHGLRGAVWHQLGDVDADARSGVRTFARADPRRARAAGGGAFVVEAVAFAALLVRAGNPIALAALPVYAALELMRARLWGSRTVVVSRAPVFRIALHDYYLVLYPLSFLIASSARHPRDLIVLAAHTLLFRDALATIVRELGGAARQRVSSASTQKPVVSSSEPQR